MTDSGSGIVDPETRADQANAVEAQVSAGGSGPSSNPPSEGAAKLPMSRRSLAITVAGLMTGMLLGALDSTIVATAGPTIIADLSGLTLYAWVFTGYIIAQTVSMPVFGKLSDLYGRKRLFLIGLSIFMVGSVFSGASQNIYELIIFRAVQGVGSGSAFPLAFAIVGTIFRPELRAKLQGIFSGVFGTASIVGPSVGSYIVLFSDWRWIFYINLPLGVISAILLTMGLRETFSSRSKPSIDYLGVVTLSGWTIILSLAFLDGGTTYPWLSWPEGLFFSAAATLFVSFIVAERRAKEPLIPLGLFRNRTISSLGAMAVLRGMVNLSAVTYIPLLMQAGLAYGIGDSRMVLNALLLPSVVSSFLSGTLTARFRFKPLVFTGLAIMTCGAYLLTLLGAGVPFWQILVSVGTLGAGMGLSFPASNIAMQYTAPRKRIGTASSLVPFLNNLGGTVGLAVLGSIESNTFASHLAEISRSVPANIAPQVQPFLADPNAVGQALATPDALASTVAANPGIASLIPQLRSSFVASVNPIFVIGFVIAAITIVLSLGIGGSLKELAAKRKLEEEEGSEEPPSHDALGMAP